MKRIGIDLFWYFFLFVLFLFLFYLCFVLPHFRYGSSSLSLNKLVPSIVKCVSDPTPAVRDAAFNTLVEIYRHVGDRVRKDLETRGNVPSAKWVRLTSIFFVLLCFVLEDISDARSAPESIIIPFFCPVLTVITFQLWDCVRHRVIFIFFLFKSQITIPLLVMTVLMIFQS